MSTLSCRSCMGLQALFARATSTVKNVGFMCFMAYMSGNGIQIFSILMTFNLLSAPISAILSSGQSEYIHLHCCPWLGVRVGGPGRPGGGGAKPALPWISASALTTSPFAPPLAQCSLVRTTGLSSTC